MNDKEKTYQFGGCTLIILSFLYIMSVIYTSYQPDSEFKSTVCDIVSVDYVLDIDPVIITVGYSYEHRKNYTVTEIRIEECPTANINCINNTLSKFVAGEQLDCWYKKTADYSEAKFSKVYNGFGNDAVVLLIFFSILFLIGVGCLIRYYKIKNIREDRHYYRPYSSF